MILTSVCTPLFLNSSLEVGLNVGLFICELFNAREINKYDTERFYSAARSFHVTAYRNELKIIPHSNELLRNAEVINWETRRDSSMDNIA